MAHILVVDDERSTLEALSTILRREGHVVLTAVSAQEALAQLEEGEELDLLLSDVRMPKMDGLELLRQLTEQQRQVDECRRRAAEVQKGKAKLDAESLKQIDSIDQDLSHANESTEQTDRKNHRPAHQCPGFAGLVLKEQKEAARQQR